MTNFKLYLFGPPRLERNDARVDLGSKKSLALLVYLAAEKNPFSRDQLAALFWPDVGHTTALANLRRTLYRVNHASDAELIHADRTSVSFNSQIDLSVDVELFHQHISACLCASGDSGSIPPACVEDLVQAADLYTADFLSGFSLPDSTTFDEWQFFRMESLRQSFNAVLKCLVQEYSSRGAYDVAVGFARRRLALDVLEESAHRDLMELYALNKQYTAAVRQYEECRRILEAELKIKPEKETVDLYQAVRERRAAPAPPIPPQAILEGTPFPYTMETSASPLRSELLSDVSHPGPPHSLPAPPFPFFGRSREMTEVQRLLVENPERRLVTVSGPGGIGKTRLAVEAASSVFRHFQDGVYLISLDSLKSPREIIPAVAEQIGLRSYHNKVEKDQLVSYLKDKQLLLILDSYEHLLPDVDFISELLYKAPWVKILVTSQVRLSLISETVFSLGEMEFPERDEVENLDQYSSVQLFIQSAMLVRPQLNITPADLPRVARICRFVQGMPLAIVLSAGWLQALNLDEIVDEIEQGLDFLEGEMRDLPERQHSVRAAIKYSWSLLDEAEQKAFMRLSVFVGGFSAGSAQQVAGVSLGKLRSLIDKSFISNRSDARCHIHELLRQFGMDQLERSGELESIRLRHSENFLSLLDDRKEDLKGRNQTAALGEIEVEFLNISAAWEYAAEHGKSSPIYTGLESLFLYCDLRGCQQLGVDLFEGAYRSLSHYENGSARLVSGSLLTHMGMLQTRFDRNNPEVANKIRTGIEIARLNGDPWESAFGLYALAHFYLDTVQDFPEALQTFRQSQAGFELLEDDFYTARAIHLAGICHSCLYGTSRVVEHFKESRSIARRIGDKSGEVILLVTLSMVHFYLDDIQDARRYAVEAANLADEIGHSASLALTDIFRGIISLLNGDLKKAHSYAKLGAAIAGEVNLPYPMLYGQALSAVLSSFTQNFHESTHLIENIRCAPADPYLSSFIHWASALVYSSSGFIDTAQEDMRSLVEQNHRLGMPVLLRLSLPVITIMLIQDGQALLAVEALAAEEALLERSNHWKNYWPAYEHWIFQLEDMVGAVEYRSAWERGKQKTPGQLITQVVESWDRSTVLHAARAD
jgi:predicted ATPase/DNA-binding SARP family transcriptional activator